MQFECRENSLTGGMDEDLRRADAEILRQGFEAANGARCFAYWKPENILTAELDASTTLSFIGQGEDVRLIDPYDGAVYVPAPERVICRDGVTTLCSVPLRDYPLLITYGDFADVTK